MTSKYFIFLFAFLFALAVVPMASADLLQADWQYHFATGQTHTNTGTRSVSFPSDNGVITYNTGSFRGTASSLNLSGLGAFGWEGTPGTVEAFRSGSDSSVCFWELADHYDNGTIVSQHPPPFSPDGFAIHWAQTGVAEINVTSGNAASAKAGFSLPSNLNSGDWNHWCITQDGSESELNLYTNGVFQETVSFSGGGTGVSQKFMRIGARNNVHLAGADPYAGSLDDVRMWMGSGGTPNVLSPLEVWKIYSEGSGTDTPLPSITAPATWLSSLHTGHVAYYKFDQDTEPGPTSFTIIEELGNHNASVVQSGPYIEGGFDGKIITSFQGGTGNLPANANIDNPTGYCKSDGICSFSFWVKDLLDFGSPLWVEAAAIGDFTNTLHVAKNGETMRITFVDEFDTNLFVAGTQDYFGGSFVHVGITMNGTDACFYKDGVLDTCGDISSWNFNSTTTGMRMFTDATGGSPYRELVDEMGVWNRELTSSEITALYAGGDAMAYSPPPPPQAPEFTTIPANETITYPAGFAVTFVATNTTGLSQVDSYWVDNTAQFTMNPSTGELTNAVTLGVGTYVVTVFANETQGGLETNVSWQVTVNQGTGTCTMSFDPGQNVAHLEEVNVSASCDTPILTFTRDGGDVLSELGTFVSLPEGEYSYVVTGTATANATGGTDSETLSVGSRSGIQAVCADSDSTWQDASALAGLIMVIALVGLILATLVLSFTGIIDIGRLGNAMTLENAPSMLIVVGLTFLVIATMSFLIAGNVCGAFGA